MGSVLGKRNNRRRKDRFLSFFGNKLASMKYTVKIEPGKERRPSKHLVVGDLHRASVIFVAGYDTAKIPLLPFYTYYPLNQKKNAKSELIDIALRAICGIVLLVVNILLLNQLPIARSSTVAMVLINAAVILLVFLVLNGIAAPINYNCNTASLALLYQLAEELKNNRKVAFLFADATTQAGVGYKYISDILGDEAKTKPVIILEGMAEGEDLYLAHTTGAEKEAERFLNLNQELHIIDHLVSDNAAENSPLGYFPKGMYFVGGSLKNGEIEIYHARSFQDSSVDLNQLEQVKSLLKQYIEGK